MKTVKKLILYMTGQGISVIGSSIVSFAIMWYVSLTTKSGISMSMVTITTFLPQALALPVGGILADRFSNKRIAMLSDSFIALTTMVLAILFISGHGSLAVIYVFNALRAVGTGIEMPAVKSILPLIVPEDNLYRANSIFTTIWCLCQLAAPGIAGVVLSLMPLSFIFMIDVITAAIGITLLAGIPITEKKMGVDKISIIKPYIETLSYVRKNRKLRMAIIVYSLISLLTAPASQLTPLLSTSRFGDIIWILSATEIVYAVSSASMSFVMSIKELPIKSGKLVKLSLVIFGATMLALAIPCHVSVFLLIMFIMGFASPFFYTPLMTCMQSSTDEAYMGRVFSLCDILVTVFVPLGMLAGSLLAEISIVVPFILFGIMLLIMGITVNTDCE